MHAVLVKPRLPITTHCTTDCIMYTYITPFAQLVVEQIVWCRHSSNWLYHVYAALLLGYITPLARCGLLLQME